MPEQNLTPKEIANKLRELKEFSIDDLCAYAVFYSSENKVDMDSIHNFINYLSTRVLTIYIKAHGGKP